MDIITESQLRSLIQTSTAPCVSIFLPTHPESRDIRQDPVRLKNLLKEAEAGLVIHGMRGTEARDLLEPARMLLDDQSFWSAPQSGLAIYLCRGFKRIWKLPIDVEDAVVVNDKFEIKPLLPLLEGKLFYILAVSLGASRLLECTPHKCKHFPLPDDVATKFEDAILGEEENQTRLLRHQGATNVMGSGVGSFHGQSSTEKRGIQEDHLFFLRQLDDGVHRVVKDDDAPLVLAGTDSIVPFYQKVSKHKQILSEWIEGNADRVANETLHERAVQMLEKQWHRQLSDLQDQYGTARAHRLASHMLEDIVPSSGQGRVDTLFVSPRNTRWGRYHEEDQRVEVHNEKSDGDIDLIDRAASQTLMNGGRLVVCKPEEVPGNKEIAAIYRY